MFDPWDLPDISIQHLTGWQLMAASSERRGTSHVDCGCTSRIPPSAELQQLGAIAQSPKTAVRMGVLFELMRNGYGEHGISISHFAAAGRWRSHHQ